MVSVGDSPVVLVEAPRFGDERGWFMETYNARRWADQGVAADFVQDNQSYSSAVGTLRGLHFQRPPHAQAKLVRCVRGAIVDIIVDMRPDSETYLQHVSVELTAENRRALYVPAMFAHGYQTLVDGTEVIYQVTGKYTPAAERGQRYSDPALKLHWPLEVTTISEKDAGWALLEDVVE